jgi:hypothetical protein
VAAAYALGRKVGQSEATIAEGRGTVDGNVIVRTGWPQGKRIAVSGSITPQEVAREIARGDAPASRAAMLESLEQALARFTVAQYGREAARDDAALDDSLAAGLRVLRKLKVEQLPVMKRLAKRRVISEVDTRAWSR